MTDLTKTTLKSPIIVTLVGGSIGITVSVLTAYFGLLKKIESLDKKVDIYITQNVSKLDGIENLKQQTAINTLTIKTITEFIKPENIDFKRYERK